MLNWFGGTTKTSGKTTSASSTPTKLKGGVTEGSEVSSDRYDMMMLREKALSSEEIEITPRQ